MSKSFCQHCSSLSFLFLSFVLFCFSSCASQMKLERTSTTSIKTDMSRIETRSVTDSLQLTGTRTVRLHQVTETFQKDPETGESILVTRTTTDVDEVEETEQTHVNQTAEDTETQELRKEDSTSVTTTDVEVEETVFTTMSRGVKIGIIFAIVFLVLFLANKRK